MTVSRIGNLRVVDRRNRTLRQLYNEPLNEETPDDLKKLLDQLK